MDVGVDLEKLEAAEQSINAFIERRARENEEQRRIEADWVESTRKYNARRREAHGAAWLEFHLRQALAAVENAAFLVTKHREAASQLTKLQKGKTNG